MRLSRFSLFITKSYIGIDQMRYWGSSIAYNTAVAAGNKQSSSEYVVKCTDLPQYDACQAQADLFRSDDKLHLRYLCNDTARCASLIAIHTSRPSYAARNSDTGVDRHQLATSSSHSVRKIILDYSRQRVTGETMEQLFDLADAVGLNERCRLFAQGYPINRTERKPVLHHVLRMPSYYNVDLVLDAIHQKGDGSGKSPTDGRAILQDVHKTRSEIQDFAYRVRCGEYHAVTSPEHTFRNVVVVATGGAHVATECVAEAIKSDPVAAKAAGLDRKLTFVSHADPVSVDLAVRNFDPRRTLVIVISETFAATDNPVMLNARTVIHGWLVPGIEKSSSVKSYPTKDIIGRHVVAITQNTPRALQGCAEFGVSLSNTYTIPTWVNLRYSVCSAVGLLPLSLQYSYPVMAEFLDGAHDMDEHFFHAPLRDNIPVILGLLGVWNSTFLGYGCRAILPFAHSLHRFPAYVQHVDMESNGKRVALDGSPLLHQSGEINFGGTGGPDNYIQFLYQGRVVPSDFIGFMESQQPTEMTGEAISNHDDMMANFFAQPDGLAYGKTLVDLIQEGIAEPLREHMVLSGNRPSSSILMTRLDAFAMGQLIAIYEHRTAVQGFIWGINSFDRFGVDLGIVLARQVRAQLSASRKTGASVQGFNASTSTLLEHFLASGKSKG
jgi:glucose-6-phosphate isomerase